MKLTRKIQGGIFLTAILLILFQPLFSQESKPLTQSSPRDFSNLKGPSVKFTTGPVIPGLQQGSIPQGMTYVKKQDKIIISHYFSNAPSGIAVIDNKTGKLTSVFSFKEDAKTFHHGHVGGIAALKSSLWVASDGKIFQYDLKSIFSPVAKQDLIPVSTQTAETKASFCTANQETLFVGEFAYDGSPKTNKSHHLKDRKGVRKTAWVCGYSAKDGFKQPQFVISIRRKVQGMHVSEDRIFLSISFGRGNRSKIVIYKNPLKEPKHSEVTLTNGSKVPLWFLDGENYLTEIDFPPMSEGITMIANKLAVLPESGAKKYQSGSKGPLDHILLLDVSVEPSK